MSFVATYFTSIVLFLLSAQGISADFGVHRQNKPAWNQESRQSYEAIGSVSTYFEPPFDFGVTFVSEGEQRVFELDFSGSEDLESKAESLGRSDNRVIIKGQLVGDGVLWVESIEIVNP